MRLCVLAEFGHRMDLKALLEIARSKIYSPAFTPERSDHFE